MTNPDGTAHVAHTSNPVQCILIDPLASAPIPLSDGSLGDIAPTILSALGVEAPDAMNRASLAPDHPWGGRRKVLLIILDGWGIGKPDETNPIFLADTPVWDDLMRCYPHSQLTASGEVVGLQPDKAGNSEAGHMNIGAGRTILQDDVRLDLAMKDGTFYRNEVFNQAIDQVKQRHTNLHLIGLLTEKSSHGSIDYPLALLKMARQSGLEQVYVHLILDGRSTKPGSAPELIEKLQRQMDEIGLGQIVSGIGRGIALDRDGDYSKTQRAFEAFVAGVGVKVQQEQPL
jgi:2,3-bisphosphoglycerate-independent phosphoglycerate mutase